MAERATLTYQPRLMSASEAAVYLGISTAALKALGLRRRVLTPKIKRYDRLDLDKIKTSQIIAARRAVGELAPKRQMEVPDIVRAFVFARDGEKCSYCGDETGPFQLEHILPVARGGSHEADNLAVACRSCNCSKGSKTLEEWRPSDG